MPTINELPECIQTCTRSRNVLCYSRRHYAIIAAAVIVRTPRWHSSYAWQHRALFASCYRFWANILVKHNNGGTSGNHVARMYCIRESCTALNIFFVIRAPYSNHVERMKCIRGSCTTLKIFWDASIVPQPCCCTMKRVRECCTTLKILWHGHRTETMLLYNEMYTRSLHYSICPYCSSQRLQGGRIRDGCTVLECCQGVHTCNVVCNRYVLMRQTIHLVWCNMRE